MGKATIINETGSGLYTVQVNHDLDRTQAMLARLDAMISAVDARIAAETDTAVLARLNARKGALEKQRERVRVALNKDYTTSAWCADLTEGLSGEIGTIEPAAELKNGINLRPGFAGDSAHSPTRDGQATPMLSLPVADAMRNFAIMPAIQKWRPTYRYGTVSNLDQNTDTCTVTLEAVASSMQNLDVNRRTVLNDVEIDYMSCNSAAFENGDDVIVEYRPYDDEGETKGQPYVIGFKDNPRACGWNLKINTINGIDFSGHTNNEYYLRIIQPIETQITHYAKGTYTEDFTVVGDEQKIDSVGYAHVDPVSDVSIDNDQPIYVQIRNPQLWTYWTTDYRGSIPDHGVVFPSGAQWDSLPSGDLGDYDYLLDSVPWVTVSEVDLQSVETSTITDAELNEYSGFLVNPTGIKLLKATYEKWNYNDIVCDFCAYAWPLDASVHAEYDEAIVKNVDISKKPNGELQDSFNYEPLYDVTVAECGCSPLISAYCEAANAYGMARKFISYTGGGQSGDSGYTFPWQRTVGSPAILASRLGLDLSPFDPSWRGVDATWDYGSFYIFTERVGTYPDYCDEGEGAGIGYPNIYTWERGKDMNWVAVDLSSEYL